LSSTFPTVFSFHCYLVFVAYDSRIGLLFFEPPRVPCSPHLVDMVGLLSRLSRVRAFSPLVGRPVKLIRADESGLGLAELFGLWSL